MNTDAQLAKLETLAIVILSGVACLAILKLMDAVDADHTKDRLRDLAGRLEGSPADIGRLSGSGSDVEGTRKTLLGAMSTWFRRIEPGQGIDDSTPGRASGTDEASMLDRSEFASVPRGIREVDRDSSLETDMVTLRKELSPKHREMEWGDLTAEWHTGIVTDLTP